jgi:hypothetical protein
LSRRICHAAAVAKLVVPAVGFGSTGTPTSRPSPICSLRLWPCGIPSSSLSKKSATGLFNLTVEHSHSAVVQLPTTYIWPSTADFISPLWPSTPISGLRQRISPTTYSCQPPISGRRPAATLCQAKVPVFFCVLDSIRSTFGFCHKMPLLCVWSGLWMVSSGR